MRTIIPIIACLFLVACNTTAQFQKELQVADHQCEGIAKAAFPDEAIGADVAKGMYSPKRGAVGKFVDCKTEVERPILVKNAPAFLDIYDAYISSLAVSAEDYDNGDISYKEYRAEFKQEAVDFNNAARNRRSQIQSQKATEQAADDEQSKVVLRALLSAIQAGYGQR